MGEFSPAQLDALEDALEDLELAGLPSGLEDDAHVGARLNEYRGLLQLSREAFPLAEVPVGVLDGVLAQARNPAAHEDAAAAPTQQTTPWWKRLSVWIPVLAVGASAALMLMMVRTTLSDAEPPATVAQAESAASDKKDAASEKVAAKPSPALLDNDDLRAAATVEGAKQEEPLELGGRGRLRGGAIAPAEDAPADALVDGEAEEADEEPEPEPEEPKAAYDEAAPGAATKVPYRDGRETRSGASKSKGKKKDASKGPSKPSPKPSSNAAPKKPSSVNPEPQPQQQSGGGGGGAQTDAQAVNSAESKRRKGNCAAAKPTFTRLTDSADDLIRARALAGLGLCALSAGDSDGAEAFFKRARTADASISGFINTQRKSLEAESL